MKKNYASQLRKLGKRVKAIRIEQEMTQEALADLCDVDVRTIQRIEKGEYGSGLDTIFALADAFEIEPSELFSE